MPGLLGCAFRFDFADGGFVAASPWVWPGTIARPAVVVLVFFCFFLTPQGLRPRCGPGCLERSRDDQARLGGGRLGKEQLLLIVSEQTGNAIGVCWRLSSTACTEIRQTEL